MRNEVFHIDGMQVETRWSLEDVCYQAQFMRGADYIILDMGDNEPTQEELKQAAKIALEALNEYRDRT